MMITSLINFIEAFLFSYFIGNYFELKFRKIYISIVTFIQFILLTYAGYINSSGLWLSVSIMFIIILSLCIWKKSLKFDYIYISLLYNSLIIITTLIGVTIISVLDFLSFDTNTEFILICCISKFILLIATMLFIKLKVNLSTTFNFKDWGNIIILDFFILVGLITVSYEVITNDTPNFTSYILLFVLFIIAIVYRLVISKLDSLNKEKINYMRTQELLKYNEQKLELMNHLKNEIAATDHRMFYMLYQIENYLVDEEYEKMEKLLEKYRETMIKYKLIIDTQNPVFDCLFSLKVNDLILKGVNVDNSIFISKQNLYNNINFINIITTILDFFSSCQAITISLSEVGSLLVVKIVYRNGKVNVDQLNNYLGKMFSSKYYNLTDFEKKGLRLSINLENFYDKYDN